jgi:hypothetical protein
VLLSACRGLFQLGLSLEVYIVDQRIQVFGSLSHARKLSDYVLAFNTFRRTARILSIALWARVTRNCVCSVFAIIKEIANVRFYSNCPSAELLNFLDPPPTGVVRSGPGYLLEPLIFERRGHVLVADASRALEIGARVCQKLLDG